MRHDVEKMAMRFLRFLHKGRTVGVKRKDSQAVVWINPTSPITCKDILLFIKDAGYTLPDTMVREMTNWLADNKYPIASCSRGYYYATKPEELDPTLSHLSGRISELRERLRKTRELQEDMRKRSNTVFDPPR